MGNRLRDAANAAPRDGRHAPAESSVTSPARRSDDPLERTRKPAARACEKSMPSARPSPDGARRGAVDAGAPGMSRGFSRPGGGGCGRGPRAALGRACPRRCAKKVRAGLEAEADSSKAARLRHEKRSRADTAAKRGAEERSAKRGPYLLEAESPGGSSDRGTSRWRWPTSPIACGVLERQHGGGAGAHDGHAAAPRPVPKSISVSRRARYEGRATPTERAAVDFAAALAAIRNELAELDARWCGHPRACDARRGDRAHRRRARRRGRQRLELARVRERLQLASPPMRPAAPRRRLRMRSRGSFVAGCSRRSTITSASGSSLNCPTTRRPSPAKRERSAKLKVLAAERLELERREERLILEARPRG